MRTASPPTEVGRICPAAYATKYARVSQAMVSSTPFALSRSCQRQAIGRTVKSISASASSEIPRIRVRDHPQRLAEVDLPDQVGEAEPGDEERQRDAKRALHLVREECTRPSAAITSAMSSSECAGESGSDRISAPARSATGSGGWSGRSSRYAVSLWTGRKWMLVAMFSSARSRWYSSRVPPARSASIRMT